MSSDSQTEDYDEQCSKKEKWIVQHLGDNLKSPTKGLSGDEKLYGLPIFWDLVQDKTINISNETMELAINSLIEILK